MPQTQIYQSMLQAQSQLTLISVIPDCLCLIGFIGLVIIISIKSNQIFNILKELNIAKELNIENNQEIHELNKEIEAIENKIKALSEKIQGLKKHGK